MPFLAVHACPFESIPGFEEIISEVIPRVQRARPFYFEDSQVVLQASHSITMFPSACNHVFIHR